MKWFMRKKAEAQPPEVQLRDREGHPFGALDRYVPLRRGELELYRTIREAVPIVDAALMKLVRLCGGVQVRCGAVEAQAGLYRFLREVDTGRGQRGLQSFLDQYLDSMLTCGQGVGEMVLDREGGTLPPCCAPTPDRSRSGRGKLPWSSGCVHGDGTASRWNCPGRSCCSSPRFSRGRTTPTACLCCAPCPSSAESC